MSQGQEKGRAKEGEETVKERQERDVEKREGRGAVCHVRTYT